MFTTKVEYLDDRKKINQLWNGICFLQDFSPWELEILGECVVMLFWSGLYKFSVYLPSIAGGTTHVKDETVANSRATEVIGNVNLSLY